MSSLVPRDFYAALERCTYLNQAALGLVPTPAVEAMHAFMERTAQHGNLYLSDQQEAEILDSVRSAGAELLGTTPDAVASSGVRVKASVRSRRCSKRIAGPSSWCQRISLA